MGSWRAGKDNKLLRVEQVFNTISVFNKYQSIKLRFRGAHFGKNIAKAHEIVRKAMRYILMTMQKIEQTL